MIGFGETINLAESVEVEFQAVEEDTRCPHRTHSASTEGNARVRFKTITPRGRSIVELNTSTPLPTSTLFDYYGITLRKLEPYPTLDAQTGTSTIPDRRLRGHGIRHQGRATARAKDRDEHAGHVVASCRPPRRSAGLALARFAPAKGEAVSETPAAERTIELHNTHTSETVQRGLPAWRRVRSTAAIASLRNVMRDYRNGESHDIDVALYDQLYDLARAAHCDPRFEIISGYRSPESNAQMASRPGSGVAKHSLHMQGRAIDVRLHGCSCADAARPGADRGARRRRLLPQLGLRAHRYRPRSAPGTASSGSQRRVRDSASCGRH